MDYVTMVTNERTMTASEFRAKCLGVFREVARTRVPVTITKRRKPIAVVLPTHRSPRVAPCPSHLHFVISCWEVALLVQKGRLALSGRPTTAWANLAMSEPRTFLAHLTPQVAVASAELGGRLQGDSADRILVATALQLGCPLVTADRRIQRSGLVPTIW